MASRRPVKQAWRGSGLGDRAYPAWFGLDAAGDPVALLIDFLVVDAPIAP